eukprot:TRINITY_DN12121_c0_g1_i1.p1 TRINITY_DN12121_c0_g1~~TRINITY_DN12121_c0_g1_i1.p1  ORF type:complete len:220 (+),score=21.86 TRINITY_DN12121_c0_g1_i1:69-728(+)
MRSSLIFAACLMSVAVAASAQGTLPPDLFERFTADAIVSGSPSLCSNALLFYQSNVYDSSTGDFTTSIDCGSSYMSNIINCGLRTFASISCARNGKNQNCTCFTHRLPSFPSGDPCFKLPFNSSSFGYTGTRAWFGNTPVSVWTTSDPSAPAQTSLLVSNGVIVGGPRVSTDSKEIEMSHVFTKWDTSPVDPNEFAIPGFCPAPKRYANTKIMPSVFSP